MNCTYYIVFEQNYKKYQWWIDKKERINKTIKDFNDNDPKAKERAEAQTKVRNPNGNKNLIMIKYTFLLAEPRSCRSCW